MTPAAEDPTTGNGSTTTDAVDKQVASSTEDAVEPVDGISESTNEAVEEAAANVSEALATEGGGGGNDDAKAKKRKERLEQNRISARESRKRKKTMIEELQRTVITLSKENKELTDRNDQLRTQLMEIASKYPNVVPLQAIMNGAPAAQVGPSPGAQQLQQQQQAAAVAAAAQATFNPLAFWPQQQQQVPQQQGLPQQAPPAQMAPLPPVNMAPSVTPPEQPSVADV